MLPIWEKREDKIIHYKTWVNFRHDFLIGYNKLLKHNNARKHIHQPTQQQSVVNIATEQLVE